MKKEDGRMMKVSTKGIVHIIICMNTPPRSSPTQTIHQFTKPTNCSSQTSTQSSKRSLSAREKKRKEKKKKSHSTEAYLSEVFGTTVKKQSQANFEVGFCFEHK